MVGNEAVAQQEMNPANTIYDAKRFIGRHFEKDDPIFKVFAIKHVKFYFIIFRMIQKNIPLQ